MIVLILDAQSVQNPHNHGGRGRGDISRARFAANVARAYQAEWVSGLLGRGLARASAALAFGHPRLPATHHDDDRCRHPGRERRALAGYQPRRRCPIPGHAPPGRVPNTPRRSRYASTVSLAHGTRPAVGRPPGPVRHFKKCARTRGESRGQRAIRYLIADHATGTPGATTRQPLNSPAFRYGVSVIHHYPRGRVPSG
jgi:hypothetical protein